MTGVPKCYHDHRVNNGVPLTDPDEIIEQAHAVAAALAIQLGPESIGGERLTQTFLCSMARAVETLLFLASFGLQDERREARERWSALQHGK
jgi:hypothetical protein